MQTTFLISFSFYSSVSKLKAFNLCEGCSSLLLPVLSVKYLAGTSGLNPFFISPLLMKISWSSRRLRDRAKPFFSLVVSKAFFFLHPLFFISFFFSPFNSKRRERVSDANEWRRRPPAATSTRARATGYRGGGGFFRLNRVLFRVSIYS